MAQRFLAIDWDQNQLHLVAASVGGGSVRFSRALVIEDAGTPSLGQAAQLGQFLRDRLKEFGITPAPVLACLGRDRVILKDIRYPAVPKHEEANVIRFQAVKELTESPDDAVIDYTPLPDASTGERRAQVHVARREIVRAYKELCQAAGLKLAGLTPRAHGMAACLRALMGTSVLVPAPEPKDAAAAIVTVGEKWAEFAILQGDTLLQTRTLTVGPGLAGEIRRNLAVHSGQQSQSPVKAVYLALSGDQSALREKLVESLEMPVHTFDPFAGADSKALPSSGRGTFSGAVGLLHLMARARALPVNFVLAKQVHAPKDPNQRLYVMAGVLLLAVFGSLLVWGNLEMSRKSADLASMDDLLKSSSAMLTQERDRTKRLQALHEWEGVPWPDELYELSAHMPKITESFKVRSLKGSVEKPDRQIAAAVPGRSGTSAAAAFNAKPTARIDLKLPAGSSSPLDTLSAELLGAGGDKQGAFYRPEAHTRNKDGTYEKILYIRKRGLEDYKDKIQLP